MIKKILHKIKCLFGKHKHNYAKENHKWYHTCDCCSYKKEFNNFEFLPFENLTKVTDRIIERIGFGDNESFNVEAKDLFLFYENKEMKAYK